ncbi:MAG: trypsin-like peptidase domain-containing protein [Deltaproteobacteria bacterium]|nr:trypsin-like peptidase domain-containing protein [Deltaproteobacteria bacterium]
MNAPTHLLKDRLPATVSLHAQIPSSHPSSRTLGQERMGSGAVVSPEGHILTVNYVVLGAKSLSATLPEGRRYPATIAAQDFDTGIAVLKVEAQGLPCATLGSSRDLKVGDPCFIVASIGYAERRAATGHVTELGPFDAHWEYMLDRAIRLTAQNPGLGGGPLFDQRGQMVGVISLNINEIAAYSLAIPIEAFRDYQQELLEFGRIMSRPRRAWVGMYSQPLDEGVLIWSLVPKAPAETAGLRKGDVVLALNYRNISSRVDLYRELWKHRPGEKVVFTVLRNQEVRYVEVTSGDRAAFYR